LLDDLVRAVLERLSRADTDERERGLPSERRMRAVAPTTGQFLFSLVAPQTACEVLEGYIRARQSDPTLVSTTVPLDRGLELSVVLSESL
jgi:hypothetical protein